MLNAGRREVGYVSVEWNDDYRAPRAVVMATEMLAQAYAYVESRTS